MTGAEVINKTITDYEHHYGHLADPETREFINEVITDRLPYGVDIKTCEDFKHLNVECCETCHTFMAESEMWVEILPDGSLSWICDGPRGVLFPKTEEELQRMREIEEFLMNL